ncbi:death domain-containing protein CRADD-like [Antedon mediterranea]|uniref:death domain-containing protein CRADD-like n=1 Tax=Antedon mediterranea TaxID=105859 RepID=UPI003AF9293D
MDDQHKYLLLSNRVRLVSDLPTDMLINYMIQDSVMTSEDSEIIESKPTKMKKNEYFLDTLPTKGPNAFPSFLKALKEMEDPLYHFVNKKLQDPQPMKFPNQVSSRDNTDSPTPMNRDLPYSTSVQDRNFPDERVSELQLNTFAGNMGADWKSFIRSLGLKENEIFHASGNANTPRDQIFSCLVKWKNRESDNATVRVLADKAKDHGLDIDTYAFLATQ